MEKLRLVFVEDTKVDYELAVKILLAEGLHVEAIIVEDEASFRTCLIDFRPNVVIADYFMPTFNGLAALQIAKKFDPLLPVIITTGSRNEEIAVNCIRSGADDYILKENMKRLPFAVRESIAKNVVAKEKANAIEELRRSESKFRSYINHAPEGIIILDEQGVFLEANDAAVLMSGYETNELLNQHYDLLLPSGSKDIGKQHFNILTETGEVFVEMQIRRKDKQLRWWAFKGVKLPGDRFMCFISDISEKKDAIQVLANSEMKYKKLISGMLQGLCLHEIIQNKQGEVVDYRFLDMNNSFEQITGLQRKDCIGKTVLEVLPRTEKYWIENYGKVALSGKPMHLENYSVEFDKYFDVMAYSPQSGQFATIVTDITEKKRIENELRLSEEKYRIMAEKSTDVLFTLDMNLYYTYISPAIERLNGYSVEESMNQHLFQVMPPESVKLIKGILAEQLAMEQTGEADPDRVAHVEFEEYHKNGSLIYVESSVRFLRNEKLEATGIIGVTRDITDRNELEKALKKNEARFRQVIEQIQAVVWEIDKEGLYTFVSPIATEVYGYAPEELVGKKYFFDLFPPELKEEYCEEIFNDFLYQRYFTNFVNQIVKKGGEKIWVTTNAAPILDEKGQLVGYRGSDQDVTDRLIAEKELIDSEAKLRAILNASQESVLMLDTTGKLLDANNVFAKRLNTTLDEAIGKDVFDYLPPEVVPNRRARMKEAINRKKPVQFEDCRSGRWMMNYIYPVFRENEVISVAIYGHDITKDKEAADALKESELRLRLAMEASQLGLFDLDIKSGVVLVNEQYAHILGYELPEYQAQNIQWLQNIHPDDSRAIQAYFAQFLSTKGSNFRFEYRQTTLQGEIVWIDTQGSAVDWDEHGNPTRIVGTHRNITQTKLAEAELKRKMEELERFNNLTVGRELKMIALKSEINELLKMMGQNERYRIVDN
ncbi:MAG: PAS domain S-box protein [Bacteroidetes bacterium]|nr:PAS domain S-box protein [Bacteroidota bacterium]